MQGFKLKKKELLKPDIDSWLQKICCTSNLSLHQNDLSYKDLETVIMENIHKLGDDKDIDLQNMLSILPLEDQKRIIRFLCFDSLKKVIDPSLYPDHASIPSLHHVHVIK